MMNTKKETNPLWIEEYENDEAIQRECSLEEFLKQKESECPCPTCQGTNIGLGYE